MKHLNLKLTVLFYLGVLTIFPRCSTNGTVKDDRLVVQNAPLLRVIIDPDTVSVVDYRKIQVALMEHSGNYGYKFQVADRSQAYAAAKKELERQHRNEAERFKNEEKYAFWAEFYGARGIVVPAIDCRTKYNTFTDVYKKVCNQFLSLVDGNTSQIIVAIEVETETSEMGVPDWKEAVNKMTAAIPKNYSEIEIEPTGRLKAYRKEAKERGEKEAAKNWKDVKRVPASESSAAEDETGEPIRQPSNK